MSTIEEYNAKIALFNLQAEMLAQQFSHTLDAIRYRQMLAMKPRTVEETFGWVQAVPAWTPHAQWHVSNRYGSLLGNKTLCGAKRGTSAVYNPQQGERCPLCVTEVAKWIVENV